MRISGTGLMPFLEKHCHPLYFARRFLEDLQEQRAYMRGLARIHGVGPVTRTDFAQHTHKTAFILGSGASINRLSPQNWAEVSRGYSFGLNFSLLQDFVPDAYSTETPDYPHDKAFEANERDLLYRLLALREEEYSKSLILIRGTAVPKFFLQNPLPPLLEGRVKMAFSLRLHGDEWHTREKYTHTYGRLMRLNRCANWFPHVVSPGLSASILFLTCMCYIVGFKKVVLCGVDLNNPLYFFEAPLPTSRMVTEGWPVPPNPPMTVHPTFNRKRYKSGVNVKDHFMMLREAAFLKSGFEICSGSPTSALIPDFPYHRWEDAILGERPEEASARRAGGVA